MLKRCNIANAHPFLSFPAAVKSANANMSTATIIEPAGAEKRIETIIPSAAQTTETTAEQIMTDLKLLKIRMEERAGKMISAEVKREPAIFIASTMITAVTRAISVL